MDPGRLDMISMLTGQHRHIFREASLRYTFPKSHESWIWICFNAQRNLGGLCVEMALFKTPSGPLVAEALTTQSKEVAPKMFSKTKTKMNMNHDQNETMRCDKKSKKRADFNFCGAHIELT